MPIVQGMTAVAISCGPAPTSGCPTARRHRVHARGLGDRRQARPSRNADDFAAAIADARVDRHRLRSHVPVEAPERVPVATASDGCPRGDRARHHPLLGDAVEWSEARRPRGANAGLWTAEPAGAVCRWRWPRGKRDGDAGTAMRWPSPVSHFPAQYAWSSRRIPRACSCSASDTGQAHNERRFGVPFDHPAASAGARARHQGDLEGLRTVAPVRRLFLPPTRNAVLQPSVLDPPTPIYVAAVTRGCTACRECRRVHVHPSTHGLPERALLRD